MEDQRLLASAALFRQLHENKKDIYDILSEFITSSINLNRLWSFNVTQCTLQLKKDYGFEIPEAVIKTCLRNRFKKDGLLTLSQGQFSVTTKFDRKETLLTSFTKVKYEQDTIKDSLIIFAEEQETSSLCILNKDELVSDFYSYFINGVKDSKNSTLISEFIVKNSADPEFTRKISVLEEGLILYSGICHSSDFANHEPWRSDFKIFLDTELLFDAAGLNGIIHQKMFDEFMILVAEIISRSSKKIKIELSYFDETKREIDDFFFAAEKIVERGQQPDPSKQGMIAIVNGCNNSSDVLLKKSNFIEKLRKYKISLDTEDNYYGNSNFNVESITTLNALKAQNPDFEDDKILTVLKLFTKINSKRKGINNKGLEQSGAVLITGKNVTKTISYNLASRDEVKLTPFASDLDFITERFWFKLNKGFGGDSKLPISFDVVARAQIILSTQAGNKVADEFKTLQSKFDSGTISRENVGFLVSELRSRNYKPEDFVPETIDEISDFMNSDFIENTLRNKTILENQVKEGFDNKLKLEEMNEKFRLKNEELNSSIIMHKQQLFEAERRRLKDLRAQELDFRKKNYKPIRSGLIKRNNLIIFANYAITLTLLALLIIYLKSSGDTSLSLISFCLGAAPLISYLGGCVWIKRFIKKRTSKKYKKIIKLKNKELPLTKHQNLDVTTTISV
ncbi:hypothetical protein [Candidatus Pantoea soli]|uniref:Uncharacterized protein n=1 Tax=Candidatus Pantoea soli TaxID=3098669 RepID=A0A518XJK1_9GAMM|nr:hypothetical protein [Pantoea soli]QDY44306.1 hypothetical protein D8B20_20485 [Pantoea soli]